MNTTETSANVEPITFNEVSATWDQQRSDDEIREFLAEKEVRVANIETPKERQPFSFLRAISL